MPCVHTIPGDGLRLRTLTADDHHRACLQQGLHLGIPKVLPFGETPAFGGLIRYGALPTNPATRAPEHDNPCVASLRPVIDFTGTRSLPNAMRSPYRDRPKWAGKPGRGAVNRLGFDGVRGSMTEFRPLSRSTLG